ncbi:MAG: peptidylprolyl isomerase [Myxococcota bacterium]|jgi:hypothetical protein|nr:peptidylprolyl isomerase [Myxococcota bacterium]
MTQSKKEETLSPADGPRRRGFLGSPLLHFIVLGCLLFFGERFFASPSPETVIRFTPADISALEQGWLDRNGQTPDPELLQALIDSEIRDELLLQQARSFGWHLTDGIVHRRLLQNQRFLEEDESISDEELLERAFEQRMDQTDLVVRRRLLERMRLLIAAGVRAKPPGDPELESYLAANPALFRRPERVGLSHVFLSRDSRKEDLSADSLALAEKLRSETIPPEQANEWGDPFLLSHHIPLSSESSIGRQYGPQFAARALEVPVGRWSDPIPSSYGSHIVWVHERSPSELPALGEIRKRVENEWLREREQQALKDHIEALRARAEIILPPLSGA